MARYHAFVSYSHAADGTLAPALRLALLRFAQACALVQRNMEAIEWARFMGDEPRRATCPPVAR